MEAAPSARTLAGPSSSTRILRRIPTSDAIVSQLWTELDVALEEADAVLVLGHPSRTLALVRHLRNTAAVKPVGITFHNPEREETIAQVVPRARCHPNGFRSDDRRLTIRP